MATWLTELLNLDMQKGIQNDCIVQIVLWQQQGSMSGSTTLSAGYRAQKRIFSRHFISEYFPGPGV